jgi:hypothetical protein
MKKLLIIGILLLLFTVCIESKKFYPKVIYIHIEGTEGLAFAGTYSNIEEETYVVGYVPEYYVSSLSEYEDTNDVFIGTFHKCVEVGTLRVMLFAADYGEQSELVIDTFTTESFGDVIVQYPD